MMKIVFNSSPLIFLSRLEFLDLFLSTEFQFLLPASVKKKFVKIAIFPIVIKLCYLIAILLSMQIEINNKV